MKKFFLFSLAVITLFISCKKDEDKKDNVYKGPVVQVHNGKAWTWVQLSKKEEPQKLAIVLNDAALNSLPVGGGGHNMDNMWVLKFHPKLNLTTFKYVLMGWNPAGHEPVQIYGKPHFDFHFYLTSPEATAAIPPFDVAPTRFNNYPAAAYFPSNYINPGGGVPMMGTHWVDASSVEFHGQPFTQTFVFGSYDGKVTFYEPMITLDFLRNHANFERSIPQPAKVQQSGWYPKKLIVSKHDGVTEIIMSDFVYRVQA